MRCISSRMGVMLMAAVLLCFSGCSFIVDLHVMNLSGKPIVVRYHLPKETTSQFTLKPTVYPVTGSEKFYALGEPLKGGWTADSVGRVVTLTLEPMQAALIGSVMNYQPDVDTLYEWKLDKLTVIHPEKGDSFSIRGSQIGDAFEEMPGRIYAYPVRF